jgi:hypothetical protein
MEMVSFTLRALYPEGKEAPVQTEYEVGGVQEPIWTSEYRKNSQFSGP